MINEDHQPPIGMPLWRRMRLCTITYSRGTPSGPPRTTTYPRGTPRSRASPGTRSAGLNWLASSRS